MTRVNTSIKGEEIQKLYDFQDTQNRDSLYYYLRHSDPSFRYRAVLAFASFQDKESLDSIVNLLEDPIMDVRIAAAYSIGQLGDSLAEPILIRAFSQQDSQDVNNPFQETILEAIGKCGSESSLDALSKVSTYKTTDDHLLMGQARAIYRFALRGITNPAATDKIVEFLTTDEYPEEVKLMAANYLFRARDIDITEHKFQVGRVLSQHKDPRIRMALAKPLASTSDPEILNILLGQLSADDDYRVKCNIIRELGNFEYISVVERVLSLLKSKNHHIANTAADYLLNNGIPNDAAIYADYAKDDIHWKARAKVYQAVHRHLPAYFTNTRTKHRGEIIQLYANSQNIYEKAALVQAMGEDKNTYPWIRDNVMTDSSMVVRMAGLEKIGEIATDDQFLQFFSGRRRFTRLQLLGIIQEAMSSGDSGLIAVGSDILQNEKAGLKNLITDITFLEDAKRTLQLPKDIETYQALQSSINYLSDLEAPKTLPTNTDHRIKWELINELSDSSRAYVFTTKGKIVFKLNFNEAPGSVANFIQLAEEDFYDGKVFHRVVPNFVIQGGCPRGDGWGNLDYSIRSELYPSYYTSEGKVGMASAGKHTECTQWFVTHSPTPHLDGNYTIFAEVVSGMDVVHNIEQGDIIEDVRILKL